jgi:CheY-like chemotaxis protein
MDPREPGFHRARVLVIDDDVLLGRTIARMLAAEHDMTVLTSGQVALDRIAAQECFDLILCDLMMREMTGADFYERLGTIAPELVSRVVIITGGAFSPWASAFLARPSIHCIDKPFPHLTEFRRVVRQHLERVSCGRKSFAPEAPQTR